MARGQSPFQGRYTVPKVDFSPIERAGGAYGRAMESIGQNVGAGIQKYQRNKQEAMTLAGRIDGELQQDPEMLKYLSGNPKHAKTLNNLTEGNFSLTEMQSLYGSMSGYENSRKNKYERTVREHQIAEWQQKDAYQQSVRSELAATEQAVSGLSTPQNPVERAEDINFLLGRPKGDNTWVLDKGITDFTKPLPALNPEEMQALMTPRHRYLISQKRVIEAGEHQKPVGDLAIEDLFRREKMGQLGLEEKQRASEMSKRIHPIQLPDAPAAALRQIEGEELTLEGKRLSNERQKLLLQGGGVQDPSQPGPSRGGTGTRSGSGGTTPTTTQGRVGELNKEIDAVEKGKYEWTLTDANGNTVKETGTIGEYEKRKNTFDKVTGDPTYDVRPSVGLNNALGQRRSLLSERDEKAGTVRVGVSDYVGIPLRPEGQSEKDTLKIQNDMVIALHNNHPDAEVEGREASGVGVSSAGFKRKLAEPSDFKGYQDFVDYWIAAGAHYREIPAPTLLQETHPIGGVSQTYAAEQWTNLHGAHARGPIIKTEDGEVVRDLSKEDRLGWVWQSEKQIQDANPDMHKQVVEVRHAIQRIQFNDNQTREQVEEVGIPFQVDVYGGQVDGGYAFTLGKEGQPKFETDIWIPMRVSMPHPDKDVAGEHIREHNSKVPSSLAFKQWEYVPARGEDGVAQWKEIEGWNVITERDAKLAAKIIDYVTNSKQYVGANESRQREIIKELMFTINGEFPAYFNEYGLTGHMRGTEIAELAERELASEPTPSPTPRTKDVMFGQAGLNDAATELAKSSAYDEAEIRSRLVKYQDMLGPDTNIEEAMELIQPLLRQKAGAATP